MSEYLPLEKSGGRTRPSKRETAQRQADTITPARRHPGIPVSTPGPSAPKVSPEASLKRLLANRHIQAKLTLGPVGDQYEQEADATARQVVSRLSTAESSPAAQPTAQRQEEEEEMAQPKRLDSIQRQPMEEEEEMMQPKRLDAVQRQEEDELMAKRIDTIQRQEEEELMAKRVDTVQRQEEEEEMAQPKRLDAVQRQEVLGAEGGEIAPEFEQSIQGARSGGQPLDDAIRAPMEGAFGADFGGVKVHTGSESDSLNQSIQARAFTSGQDIFFRGGEYSPGSSGGQELLAHELTHVVQQNGPAVQQKREE